MLTYQDPQMKYCRNMNKESRVLSAVCIVSRREDAGCGRPREGGKNGSADTRLDPDAPCHRDIGAPVSDPARTWRPGRVRLLPNPFCPSEFLGSAGASPSRWLDAPLGCLPRF